VLLAALLLPHREAPYCLSVFPHASQLIPLPCSSSSSFLTASFTCLAAMQYGSKSVQKHLQHHHCRVGTFVFIVPAALQIVPPIKLAWAPCFSDNDPSVLCPARKACIPLPCLSLAAGHSSSCPSLAPHETHTYLLTSSSYSTTSQKLSWEVHESREGHGVLQLDRGARNGSLTVLVSPPRTA